MSQIAKVPLKIEVEINDEHWEEYAKSYLENLYERTLRPHWLTMEDMERITRHKRAWIMKFVVDDPYVRRNKLAKKEGESRNGQWIFHAEKIRPFLDRLFDNLPDY